MNRPLVVFHGGCRDGYCAAWVCKSALAAHDPEFHEGYYGQAPPLEKMKDRDVVIVDFSYPLAEMKQIAEVASTLLMLDHHKSAAEDLAQFQKDAPNARVVFDMTKSGAKLAWDNYFPDQPPPWLVAYVEDRDLWRHALSESRRVNAWISTLPFEFDAWNEAAAQGVGTAANYGFAVVAKMEQYIREVSKNARMVVFHEHVVPVVSAPQCDISELLDKLRQDYPFAIGWWQRADGKFQYSLRSKGDFDVSEIAKAHHGGGHRNAAGFESMNLINMVPAAPAT